MFGLLLSALFAVAGDAERPPIVTDRPDIAESSLTVPEGSFQVETGIEAGSNSSLDVNGTSLGFPTKLRFGVIDGFELHAEGTVFDRFTVDGPAGELSASGFADLELGGKAHLVEGEGGIPSLGFLAALRVPIGGDEVTGDLYVIRATLAADWELLPSLSLGTNVGLTVPLENRELFSDGFRYAASFNLHPELFPAGLSVFAETFGLVPLGDGDEVLGADTGALYLVNDDFQLDVYARFGLTDSAQDLIVGGGGSFRF